MTFSFHIGEALLIERAIFVALTIVIFGLISIGGLYLLRRRLTPSPSQSLSDALDHLDTVMRSDSIVAAAIAGGLVRTGGGRGQFVPQSENSQDIPHPSGS